MTKDNNTTDGGHNTTHTTNDSPTQTPLKSVWVSSSCSTSGTRHVAKKTPHVNDIRYRKEGLGF